MIKTVVIVTLFILAMNAAESKTTYENTNFTLSTPLNGTGEQTLYNYNRFRIDERLNQEHWFAVAIGDIKNILSRDWIRSDAYKAAQTVTSDTPFSTQTKTVDYTHGQLYAQLYRLYGGYTDEQHRVSLGLQKVSMGVGRIWNPTDLFNPKNPLALEPDEVYGVMALSYTYSPSPLSQITAVAAQRGDNSYKYAGRVKGYLGLADVAIDTVTADDVSMIGYELEGEWFTSGIELRSEGGWFNDKLVQKQFFQGLIGADYAFENSFTLIGEWLHTSRTFDRELQFHIPSGALNNLVRSRDYLSLSCTYQFDPLVHGTLVAITSSDDGSFYLGPALHYSLDDDISLGLGALFYGGKKNSEFGDKGQTYYLNFKITF